MTHIIPGILGRLGIVLLVGAAVHAAAPPANSAEPSVWICGDGPDDAWMLSAERNIDAIRALKMNPPDHLVFSTWHNHPTKNLPETSPQAFTHLIDYYFAGH